MPVLGNDRIDLLQQLFAQQRYLVLERTQRELKIHVVSRLPQEITH